MMEIFHDEKLMMSIIKLDNIRLFLQINRMIFKMGGCEQAPSSGCNTEIQHRATENITGDEKLLLCSCCILHDL